MVGGLKVEDLKNLFEASTGQEWNPEDGVLWLMQHYEDLQIYYKEPKLMKSAHVTLSDKGNWLAQQSCAICDPDFPIRVIPIRIEPESWQSLRPVDKRAFKAAVASRLGVEHVSPISGRICISLLFVCSSHRRMRDVDNLAKLMIDAVKGILMGDDKDVDHLSLVRLDHSDAEEYVVVRISNSHLNDHRNVVYPALRHGWAGAVPLKLEDFRES
jgi:Holliday junction resolvase RusA-like endonuclease